MAETPLSKEYNKPEENILSTKKSPEVIRQLIESHSIDIQDIIELKTIREKMKTDFSKLKNELQKPEKPGNPPEEPGKPRIGVDSQPGGEITVAIAGQRATNSSHYPEGAPTTTFDGDPFSTKQEATSSSQYPTGGPTTTFDGDPFSTNR